MIRVSKEPAVRRQSLPRAGAYKAAFLSARSMLSESSAPFGHGKSVGYRSVPIADRLVPDLHKERWRPRSDG